MILQISRRMPSHVRRRADLRAGVALWALAFALSAQGTCAQDPTPVTKADWQQDPEYRADWGLEGMNTSDAYAAGWTGRGVTVGVVDSGIFAAHPEFADGRVRPVDISGTYYADGYYLQGSTAPGNTWTAGQTFNTPGIYDGSYNDPHGTLIAAKASEKSLKASMKFKF
jgi:subtilisin family serine protease